MFLKTTLVLFTCSSFILGSSINPRVRRQAVEAEAQGGIDEGIAGVPDSQSESRIFGLPGGIPSIPQIFGRPTTPSSSVSPGPSESPNSSGFPSITSIPSIPGIPGGNSGSANPVADIISIPVKAFSKGVEKVGESISNGINSGVKAVGSGISQVANRVQNAANQTIKEEEKSVKDSFNSVKDLLHQKIETGSNITKTAFDLGTVGPKFFKNVVTHG